MPRRVMRALRPAVDGHCVRTARRSLGLVAHLRGMPKIASFPPPPDPDQIVIALHDKRARKQVFPELYAHLDPRLHLLLRRLGVEAADREDAVQEALTHLLEQAHRAPRDLESPLGWVWTVASNKARDQARCRRKLRRADGEVADRALETGGATESLLHDDVERALEDAEAQGWFDEIVASYVERADREGRVPRGHHIQAWVDVQVRGDSTSRVAERLSAARGVPTRIETVWKWSQRGRSLAIALADNDRDGARAALIRRVAAATGRAAA